MNFSGSAKFIIFSIVILTWNLRTSLSAALPISALRTASSITSVPWINDNVVVFEPLSFANNRNPFLSLVPLVGRGCDVSMSWKDPQQGAHELAYACFPNAAAAHERNDARDIFIQGMERFQAISFEDGIPPQTGFSARIISSRGRSGIKCPRWHMDHVVVRHIQALVGPGCDYLVSEAGVDRSVVNHADEIETAQINQKLVNPILADICHGSEGGAIILRGMEAGCRKAAVHKSPEILWWQGRVLLTLDIAKS